MTLERDIERLLVRRVESLGGTCEKFISPGKSSVPDRLITMPCGKIIFAEIKAPGKKPTALQARDHARRRAMGCDVRVIDSKEAANAFEP
jgi:hypothetical protein